MQILEYRSFIEVKKNNESLRWRHNEHDSVSNHQPYDCLLNCLFRRRSKITSSSASLAFVRGIHRGPVNSLQKGPVTRKIFPFDDVIMVSATIFPFQCNTNTFPHLYMCCVTKISQALPSIATVSYILSQKRSRKKFCSEEIFPGLRSSTFIIFI